MILPEGPATQAFLDLLAAMAEKYDFAGLLERDRDDAPDAHAA